MPEERTHMIAILAVLGGSRVLLLPECWDHRLVPVLQLLSLNCSGQGYNVEEPKADPDSLSGAPEKTGGVNGKVD